MSQEAQLWQTAKAYQENQDSDNLEKTLLKLLTINPRHVEALRWLGGIAAKRHDFQKASHYFQQALLFSPDHYQLHHDLALSLVNQDKLIEAKKAYETTIALNPDFAEAHNNLASLCYKQGDFDTARQYCQKAITLEPDYLAAHYNLALIDMQQSEFESAMQHFQHVLSINPDHGHAHFHLANLLAQHNQSNEAIQHYEQAIEKQPTLVSAYANLASIHLKQHHVDDAKTYYELALQFDPDSIDVHFNMGVISSNQGNIANAIYHYQKALDLEPNHCACLQNLGACYYKQNDTPLAIQYYKKALAVTPEDANLRYLLRALQQDKRTETAPNSYIKTLFDDYASDYDNHIQQLLCYQVPTQLVSLIEENYPLVPYTCDILDLGCGTGLMGEKIKPYARSLLGVDLSKPMLEKAHEKKVYHQLVCSDIKPFLSQCDTTFDFIIAADVLGYIGKLEPIFSYLPHCLNKQGIFAFSIELTEEALFSLQPTGRFQHGFEYIHNLANQYNLQIIAEKPETIRLQKGLPVKGVLFLLQKKVSNS